MFNSWIKNLELIPASEGLESTNVLRKFPHQVKKILVAEVVSQLFDQEIVDSLTTPAHVRWVLEVVGHGFALPMENLTVIEQCVAIYRNWLVKGGRAPKGFEGFEQSFWREMFGHLSYLFEPRASDGEAIKSQIRICKYALEEVMYANVKGNKKELSRETWSHYILLALGTVDGIFKNFQVEMGHVGSGALFKALAPLSFRLLMEYFLYSETMDEELWEKFVRLARDWIDTSIFEHWNAVLYGLTRRALTLMYGEWSESAECLEVEWTNGDGTVTKRQVEASGEFVFFALNWVMNAIPEPVELRNAAVHMTFFRGVFKVVDLYLELGDVGSGEKRYPSRSDVLELFGGWIFKTLLADEAELDEGNALAAASMCRIYCATSLCGERFRESFKRMDLARFYTVLMSILTKSGVTRVLCTTLVSVSQLFLKEFDGAYVLVPFFLYAFVCIWKSMLADPNVRSACINLLATVLCVSEHFSALPRGEVELFEKREGVERVKPFATLPFAVELEFESPRTVSVFSDVRPHLASVLALALVREDNVKNVVKLLSLVMPLVFDGDPEDERSGELARYMVSVVLRKVRELGGGQRSYGAVVMANAVLESLTGWRGRCATRCMVELAERVVEGLVEQLEGGEDEKALGPALMALSEWLSVGGEVTGGLSVELRERLVEVVLKIGKSGDVRRWRESMYALEKLYSQIETEWGGGELLGEASWERHFLTNGFAIMSVVEAGGGCYLTLRNEFGRKTWRVERRLYDELERGQAVEVLGEGGKAEEVMGGRAEEVGEELRSYLAQRREARSGAIGWIEDYMGEERKYEVKESECMGEERRWRATSGQGRLFLSNLGCLSPGEYEKLTLLEESEKLKEELEELDKIPERARLQIGVGEGARDLDAVRGPVTIVWSEGTRYRPLGEERGKFVHIVISPMECGLFCVQIYAWKNKVILGMPLVNNTVLSRRALGVTVRHASIAAARYLQPEKTSLAQAEKRHAKIRQISSAHARPMSYCDFVSRIMLDRWAPFPQEEQEGDNTSPPSDKSFVQSMKEPLNLSFPDLSNPRPLSSPPRHPEQSYPLLSLDASSLHPDSIKRQGSKTYLRASSPGGFALFKKDRKKK
ncbi:uncharacterized protein LOC126318596 [Schistocerca gregaria]|uniref:uncharacterized protein LOC126318596 n=1 Tax=Schistocerca gregaria TaxID=7010 RepID=UPI00211E655F|nr:uncharacterized protein LOC126318596 [Schistocerca gregaria]